MSLTLIPDPANCAIFAQPPDSPGSRLATRDDASDRSARASQGFVALAEMTSGIAHDFRNILTVIESGLRMAEDHVGDAETFHSCLAASHQGVERGFKLTSRLLAFAKQREGIPAAENINELLRTLETFLKFGAGPDVRVQLDLAVDVPACLVDPSQFNAAILNLVVNARDAMPGGGVIRISTAALVDGRGASSQPGHGSFVRVRIRDDGEGMTADVASRIFDPYFTTKGEAGTGLGIPQVCAFMKAIGGDVSVDSAVGAGTVFDLTFPALPAC